MICSIFNLIKLNIQSLLTFKTPFLILLKNLPDELAGATRQAELRKRHAD